MSGKVLVKDVEISKALSWLLRHGALKERLAISPEGFVNVRDILEHRTLRGKCSVDDIKRIVANNDKQRFALRTTGNGLEIRANQGHSVQEVNSLELTPIRETSEVKNIIHGTFYKQWQTIKTQGLSRMKRNHIHFAEGLPNDKEIISGMRRSCEIYIYINPSTLLASGIQLFRSTNGVILSPGNQNGIIEPKYFLKVLEARTLKPLI